MYTTEFSVFCWFKRKKRKSVWVCVRERERKEENGMFKYNHKKNWKSIHIYRLYIYICINYSIKEITNKVNVCFVGFKNDLE